MKPVMLKTKKKISWLTKISGAATHLLEICSPTCSHTFNFIGMILLITAVFSGLTLGFGISVIALKNLLLYPLVFSMWALFIYYFDRSVILSNNSFMMKVRVTGIIIIAVLNSIVLDSLLLNSDIMGELKKEYNAEISSINKKYDSKISPLQIKIENLTNDNRKLNKGKIAYIDSLQAEGRGYGGSHRYGTEKVYRNLERLKDEFKLIAVENTVANNLIITELKNEIAGINNTRKNEISALVGPDEAGWMNRVNKLHDVVFVKGNFGGLIFFILLFCVFCFFESLPLQAKLGYNEQLSEYFKAQDAERENYIKKIDMAKHYNWNLMQSELLLDHQLRLIKVTTDSFIKRIEQSKEDSIQRLKLLEEAFNEFDQMETKLKNMFPDLYKNYVKPEADKAREELIKSMNVN